MTARKDYGPQGCAEDGAVLLAIIGALVAAFAGAFQLGWRVTTAYFHWREMRRA